VSRYSVIPSATERAIALDADFRSAGFETLP